MTIFAALLTLFQLHSAEGGRVWFYGADATVAYEACRVDLTYVDSTVTFAVEQLTVRCDRGPGYLFEQSFEPLALEKIGAELRLGGAPIGRIMGDSAVLDFKDEWESRQRLRIGGLGLDPAKAEVEWYVESFDHVSFDLLAEGFASR